MIEDKNIDEAKLKQPLPTKRYFTISEVSELCQVKPHVLRYWEQEFNKLRPNKRGNRRYYQYEEVMLVRKIRELLYGQLFTIKGARAILEEEAKNRNSRMRPHASETSTRIGRATTNQHRSMSIHKADGIDGEINDDENNLFFFPSEDEGGSLDFSSEVVDTTRIENEIRDIMSLLSPQKNL